MRYKKKIMLVLAIKKKDKKNEINNPGYTKNSDSYDNVSNKAIIIIIVIIKKH